MGKADKYPTSGVNLGSVRNLIQGMGFANPVQGYAIMGGAQFAIETHEKRQEDILRHNTVTPLSFDDLVAETRQTISSEGLDRDPWKKSDEFYLGIVLGAYIARHGDDLPDAEPIAVIEDLHDDENYGHASSVWLFGDMQNLLVRSYGRASKDAIPQIGSIDQPPSSNIHQQDTINQASENN